MWCYVFVVFQVVETNLVAFDCHWILINEVGVFGIIYWSCTMWPPFTLSDDLGKFMVLSPFKTLQCCRKYHNRDLKDERRHLDREIVTLFYISSSNNTNWLSWEIIFIFNLITWLCTSNANNAVKILHILYSDAFFFSSKIKRDKIGDLGRINEAKLKISTF